MLYDCPLPSFDPSFIPEAFNSTYMFSNEDGIQDTFDCLGKLPFLFHSSSKLHVGFAFWFNLNLIAKRASAYAIICDIDPGINVLFECVREAVLSSQSREIFVDHLIKKIREKKFIGNISDIFDEAGLTKRLKNELEDRSSWLSNEKYFLHVKSIFEQRKIICRKLNMTSTVEFLPFVLWLQRKIGLFQLDTFYISNISEWLSAGQLSRFEENIDIVLSYFPKTTVIDAFYKYRFVDHGSGPPQRLSFRVKPSFKKQSINYGSKKQLSTLQFQQPARMTAIELRLLEFRNEVLMPNEEPPEAKRIKK